MAAAGMMLPGSGASRLDRGIHHDGLRQQCGEISGAERIDGHAAKKSLRLTDALAFVIGEEEELVLAVEDAAESPPGPPRLKPNWFSLKGGIGLVGESKKFLASKAELRRNS